ncbi:hypothetical protein DLM75_23865 [Leptospira stimsonii]|uniref:Uncharacterized protein n=1 Tax=Leptospira stimsonii TaxID=2202203 RepID=A0A396YQQ3_9LEPT|nr:hypothetical protein DLM75_23865 [Leptospira stimsonii]
MTEKGAGTKRGKGKFRICSSLLDSLDSNPEIKKEVLGFFCIGLSFQKKTLKFKSYYFRNQYLFSPQQSPRCSLILIGQTAAN